MTNRHYTIRAIFADGDTIEVTGSNKKTAENRYIEARNAADKYDVIAFQITTPRGITKEVSQL